MKVAIFGGTGRTGTQLVRQALEAGHEVRMLARDPGRVATRDDRLVVVRGDVQDAEAVDATVAGTEGVLSVLGPTRNTPDHQVSAGMRHIVSAMEGRGIRRLIVAAGAGVGAEGDRPGPFDRLIGIALRLAARHVLEDMVRTVAIVRDSPLDWTVVRVPMLTDDAPRGDVRVGMVGSGTGPRLARADLARFMLAQLGSGEHVRASPVISA